MLQASLPISVLQKVNNNREEGQNIAYIYVGIELILEQLVNNTPPASINSNIVSVFKSKFNQHQSFRPAPSQYN